MAVTRNANKMTNTRKRTSPAKSKEELWKDSLEKTVDGGAVIQMTGVDSSNHTVYARVILRSPADEAPVENGATKNAQVTIGSVVEAAVDEEWKHLVKDILEKKERIQNDSRPCAKELLRLGAVWLVNETAYTQGGDAHAHRLLPKDYETIPKWEDMTLRVHYQPDRFHAANEVEWHKYCRGLLVGGSVEASIGDEKCHVPFKGMPDSKDGVVVHEDEDLGYAVLNKPEGVPGHGSTSNHLENVVMLFHEALKEIWPKNHRKIHVTTPLRIDNEIQGLVLVSLRKESGAYLVEQPVTRKYRCLVTIKDDGDSLDKLQNLCDTETVISHYYDPKCMIPKKKFVRNHPKQSAHPWIECQMRITKVGFSDRLRAASVSSQYDDVNEPDVTLAHRLWRPDSAANPADDLNTKYVMQLEIEDLTGRPHQLRGQLAAMGVPIVGDALYGGGTCVTGAHRHTWKRMALQCFELSFMEPQWEETEGEGGQKSKTLVPSERKSLFRLNEAWWTSYMEEYAWSV